MASVVLRRLRPTTKEQIADKSTDGNSNHDPTIICHEQKPSTVSMRNSTQTVVRLT